MKAKAILSAITGFFFCLITYLVLRYLDEQDALLFAAIGGLFFLPYTLCFSYNSRKGIEQEIR